MRSLPNLVIVGVPKAGTTSLFEYLAQHPAIQGSREKEPGFFMHLRDGTAPRMTMEEYLALFEDVVPPPRHRMEATARYAFGGPPLISALQEVLPDPRCILVIRDPVDRLWSAYWSQSYSRRFQPTMRTGLDRDWDSFLRRCEAVATGRVDPVRGDPDWVAMRLLHEGRYGDWLQPWFDAFGNRFRVVFFDHLRADPEGTTRGLFRWLDLDASVPVDVRPRNRTVAPRSAAVHAAAQWFRQATGLRRRAPGLNRVLTTVYERVNTTRGAPRSVDGDTQERLHALYRDSNRRLVEILEGQGLKELPDWIAAERQHGPTA